MQIQRKSNGSAALRIAGRLIFSSACLLAVGGIAALVVSLLFCHASSLDLVNSFPRLLPVCFACKIEERSRTDGGKKNLCAMISTDLHAKIMAEKRTAGAEHSGGICGAHLHRTLRRRTDQHESRAHLGGTDPGRTLRAAEGISGSPQPQSKSSSSSSSSRMRWMTRKRIDQSS